MFALITLLMYLIDLTFRNSLADPAFTLITAVIFAFGAERAGNRERS